ncbi:MAG: organomercurial transporter MerC [Pseudomonadales bacterium]|nr:organomercurial transporter MerC [Pseudomonadales bacterium]NRA17784.1 organomercurial transporter MerC [Oceanospirillaceae bacterium]
MSDLLNNFSRLGDKTGSLGTVISAMGCGFCFPAIASLGSALGLGFLSQWESLFVSTLFPLFASIVLLTNALGWFKHRQWRRSALGMLGPGIVLIAFYPFFMYAERNAIIYSGIALMMAVSLWDIFSPANKKCKTAAGKVPQS